MDDVKTAEIYFCEKGHKAEIIHRSDLSLEKREKIRALHLLDKRWNAAIPLYFVLWFAAGWAAVTSDNTVVDILSYMVGGLALSTLSVLAHESTHNLFTHNPKLDRWIGFVCGLPILLSPTGYRQRHPLHHKFVKGKNDPDNLERMTESSRVLPLLYVAMIGLGAYLFLFDVPIQSFRHGTPSQRRSILLETLIMALLISGASLLLPLPVVVEGWLLPLLISVQIANVRGVAEHGFMSGGNELIDTRTVVTNRVLSFLMCNINYHLEHHLYPGVPWYNLPKLHRLLEEDYRRAGASVYTSYSSFLKDVITALRRGVVPGLRLIPAHLRDEICL